MARYSLFVLKVPLNPKQTNKHDAYQQCQCIEGVSAVVTVGGLKCDVEYCAVKVRNQNSPVIRNYKILNFGRKASRSFALLSVVRAVNNSGVSISVCDRQ